MRSSRFEHGNFISTQTSDRLYPCHEIFEFEGESVERLMGNLQVRSDWKIGQLSSTVHEDASQRHGLRY